MGDGPPQLCKKCETGVMERNEVRDAYVLWMCSDHACVGSDVEHFSDMDDSGWAWLRAQYREEL